jgi:hypothetical protein
MLKLWALGEALNISFFIRNKHSDNTEGLSELVYLKRYSYLYTRMCVNTVLIYCSVVSLPRPINHEHNKISYSPCLSLKVSFVFNLF